MTTPEEVNERSQSSVGELTVLEIALVLARRKRVLIVFPFVVALIAAGMAVSMPNVYTASAKMLPPQQSASAASALLNQLGSLGGLAGAAATRGSGSDIYIGMLKSRTVADGLIARFDLSSRYKQELMSGTRAALAGRTEILTGKDGVISIDVDDTDPKMAANLANGYVEELKKLTSGLAVTEASQRRLFYENQLAQARANLAVAQAAARKAIEKGGVSSAEEQGRTTVELIARLRAQVSVKEIQIGVMRSYAAENNPELKRAQEEVAVLKRELSRYEGASGAGLSDVAAKDAGSGLENYGRLRDAKYYETVYELLARQYELAKIDESKDSTVIQVMDRAIEPDRKSKPVRSRIVLLSAFGAFLLSVFWVLGRELASRAAQDPDRGPKFAALRQSLWWR